MCKTDTRVKRYDRFMRAIFFFILEELILTPPTCSEELILAPLAYIGGVSNNSSNFPLEELILTSLTCIRVI
jgi:hypothetical protein